MTCADFTNLVDEDHEDYCEGWIPLSETNKKRTSCRVDEYKYISASTLSTLPVWGTLDTYGAGGYVIRLKASNKNLKEKFTRLMEQKWIDHRTRAVIIDFASYNAQVNLFGVSRLLAEFTPGGGIIPSYR
ncbi:hypothetical protein SK128_010797 [Halocaridina rubra]|uniref:Polycystin domain-containing protein n=1 Tax=Halocaridina rubra TaxID=373956 RepID=A0AAN8WKB5_HALRR